MNVESKKKYEFLESFSAIMDAHLRYFKQVTSAENFLWFGSNDYDSQTWKKFSISGIWFIKSNGTLDTSGTDLCLFPTIISEFSCFLFFSLMGMLVLGVGFVMMWF